MSQEGGQGRHRAGDGVSTDHDEPKAEAAEQAEPPPSLDPTPIRPGAYYARLAYKRGCEDEYSNRMAERYGGEW